MRKNVLLAVVVLVHMVSNGTLFAQDIHFSQFNSAPLILNPALSGLNSCDYRVSSIFKGQWGSVSPNRTFTYRTLAASYDMALFKGPKYKSYGGLGMSLYSDQAGDANFSTNKVDFSAAYHMVVDKVGKQAISVGIQGGIGHRSIDQSLLFFDTQFDPDFGFDPNGAKEYIERDKFIFGDIAAGLLWSFSPSEASNYYLGLMASHLNQPNLSFLQTPSEQLYIKFGTHGGATVKLSEKIDLMPSFMALKQGPANQVNVGTYIKYKTANLEDGGPAFYLGTWARFTNPLDGIILAVRTDVSGFNIGFSYDVNLSSLTAASSGNGGPEISLIYTGCISKTKSASYCPKL